MNCLSLFVHVSLRKCTCTHLIRIWWYDYMSDRNRSRVCISRDSGRECARSCDLTVIFYCDLPAHAPATTTWYWTPDVRSVSGIPKEETRWTARCSVFLFPWPQRSTWHTHVECLVWHVVCTRGRITKLCCACSGVTVLDGSLPKIEMLSLVLVTCRMLLFFPVCMIWSVVRHVYYTSRDMWFEFIWRRSETTGLWSPESKWREICYFILSSIY